MKHTYNKINELVLPSTGASACSSTTTYALGLPKHKLKRIKLATTHRDVGKIYQSNFVHERNKIPERNEGRLNATIILRPAKGITKNMVYVWLIIKE